MRMDTTEIFTAADGRGPGQTLVAQSGATTDATLTAFIAPMAGSITAVYAKLGTACGGAETVSVDVQIAGSTALSATIDLAAADSTNSKTIALAGAGAANFAAGELVTVVINQTTGGADTAANLSVSIAWFLA